MLNPLAELVCQVFAVAAEAMCKYFETKRKEVIEAKKPSIYLNEIGMWELRKSE